MDLMPDLRTGGHTGEQFTSKEIPDVISFVKNERGEGNASAFQRR